MNKIDNYKYDNKDYLGKGSFGKVYKGIMIDKNKEVAIKIMNMAQFQDKSMLISLETEITVMKQFRHENIVELIDVFGDNKYTYMIIQLCDGDLRNYIKSKGGILEEAEALGVLRQFMQGCQEMIKKGYIHRDIKPENVLYKGNCFKIADFGFATKADTGSNAKIFRQSVGTPLYMAPQLLERQPYTAKSDIWSIGIMAYEMVYGKQPWPCRDIPSYALNIKNQPLKFPVDKRVSDEYQDFIKKCLKKDEKDRISWDELFNHVILNEIERNYKMENRLDQECQKILAQIQKIVQSRGLDVFEQFQKYDKDSGGSLDFLEFFSFLIQLDPRLSGKEIKLLFDKMDINQDQSIGYEEFKKIFFDYDYVKEDFAERIIIDLREIIRANNLQVEEIFAKYDKDQMGDLDFEEFSFMIKEIAKDIKDDDIQAIFDKFDTNNDRNINIDEFRDKLIVKKESQKNQIQENLIQNFVKELRRIVIENKIDIQLIFKNFAKSMRDEMNQTEFSKLCSVIDRRLKPFEREYIFKYLNLNDRDGITFHEFSQIFK
ncbi:unnamed protein product [Paramecium pentaurelia]|uniref:Calcium-dependent protein kinase n=1 Tax=Paramecium pentaurelia TaxID=43138 RepID=A0A8S1SXW3_9CILI|nr:unnamed protein product [Paramecium pentaurelia]